MQWRIQDFRLGGADLRHVCFSAKTYVKTKELDPVGGGRMLAAPPWIRQCYDMIKKKITARK